MNIKLSEKVSVSAQDELYFVKIDGEVVGYARTEEGAEFYIEELSKQMAKELLEKQGGEAYAKVFSEKEEVDKYVVSYQLLGNVWNGSITPVHTIEFQRVHQLV